MSARAVTLLIALGLASLTAQAVCAQTAPDTYHDNLIGPVKAVRVEAAYLDKGGHPDKNGRWLSRLINYDDSGNRTEDETFYAFGKASYGRYSFKYSGRHLVEKAHQVGPITNRRFYFYNEIGQLYLEDGDAPGDQEEYSYSSDGKRIEARILWRNGALRGKRVMLYDDEGRLVDQSAYDSNGNLELRTIRTYDGEGRLASEASGDDPTDEYFWKTVYQYDDGNNIVKEKRYDHNGLSSQTSYTYEFDFLGNWIKQMAIIRKGRDLTAYQTYRTLTYDDRIRGDILLNLLLNERRRRSERQK